MSERDFEIITFDCYGTLINWEGGITSAFQQEAARAGVTFDASAIISAYHHAEPVVESVAYLPYRDVLAETARRVADALGLVIAPERANFLADSLPDWSPFPDTNAALKRLAQRFPLGILSNIDDDLLAATRRHFTVDFDLIVTAQQVSLTNRASRISTKRSDAWATSDGCTPRRVTFTMSFPQASSAFQPRG